MNSPFHIAILNGTYIFSKRHDRSVACQKLTIKIIIIGKVWVAVIHTLRSALESAQEAKIVQIDSEQHQGILYKLCSLGIGGSALYILTRFLSNRSQHIMVDGCRSKLVNVVSQVPQLSVLGQLLFLLYTSELFPFCKMS